MTDGMSCLPRPVIAADEQQWALLDGLLADAAGWHQDRVAACAGCKARPDENCASHQDDVAQIRDYVQLITALRTREVTGADTPVFAAAAAKAAARRRAQPGADDQALAAAYDELGCQLTYSRLADTTPPSSRPPAPCSPSTASP